MSVSRHGVNTEILQTLVVFEKLTGNSFATTEFAPAVIGSLSATLETNISTNKNQGLTDYPILFLEDIEQFVYLDSDVSADSDPELGVTQRTKCFI